MAFDLPVQLDASIRSQSGRVHAALRQAIVEGRLAPGLRLPSSRGLADQLALPRNAVVAAYEHLLSDGLAEARHGSGTYVCGRLPAPGSPSQVPAATITTGARRPFALGCTDVDASLLRRLAAGIRRHIVTAGPEGLGYGDARGSRHFREQIAAHLAANRGVRCDPEHVVVVSGTQHGIRLCVDALLAPGDAVWMEEPGYYATHATLRAAGMRLVPVPVDGEGIDVAAGRSMFPTARAAYVTPSHQFPTGVTMSMRRRIALLEWAEATGGWIIEDDYDSEFRYAGPPLTALAGLGGKRVIYIGTLSKTLFPGLRLAYLVLPPGLVPPVVRARAAMDRFAQPFLADAVAGLMAQGLLSAHIRRMRNRYRKARDLVVAGLRETAGPALQVQEPSQGLHLLALLPADAPAGLAALVRDRAGIDAKLLSETCLEPVGRDGFILGFSGHDARDLQHAASHLGAIARATVG